MFISIVRGSGNMRLPSLTTVILLAVQILLGAFLGLGLGPIPQLGMPGVALASVIAYAGAAAFLFAHLRSKRARVPLSFRGIPMSRELFAEILGVGLITCISPLQTTLSVLIVTALVSNLGADAIAGYGIGSRLEMVLVPIAFGIGVACVPMVGMAIGAGNVIRARRVAATGAALSAIVLGLIGTIAWFTPYFWANIFTGNPRSLQVAYSYLSWSGPAYPFFGLGLCLLFASQGARKVLGPVLAGTTRLMIMAIGGWWIAAVGVEPQSCFALVAAGMVVYGFCGAVAVYFSDWRPRTPLVKATQESQTE